jgi:hypothetical protein
VHSPQIKSLSGSTSSMQTDTDMGEEKDGFCTSYKLNSLNSSDRVLTFQKPDLNAPKSPHKSPLIKAARR